MRFILSLLLFSVLAACFGPGRDAPDLVRFIALGDAPYGDPAEVDAPYKALLAKISDSNPPLVIHVGDLHGVRDCGDTRLDQLRGYLNSIAAPVLYTPGDNEWTDCAGSSVGAFDPLERLAHIRKTYFGTDTTLGAKPVPSKHQGTIGYPENRRLRIGTVGFITVHVVGSNNNFSTTDLDAVREFMKRNDANVRWLNDSFAAFADADAIVVALHADMFIPTGGFQNGWWPNSPFRDIGVTLGQQSSALEKPVLLLYGDSHVHKDFKPFPKHRPFLHAIEVFGYPDIKAIEITVDPTRKKPFRVSKELSP